MIAIDSKLIPPIAKDVVDGLSRVPKSLPPKLFYDAEGSRLFEAITQLPEYYPTRIELSIFQEHAREIAATAGKGVAIVELGAGSANKTRSLLEPFVARQLRVRYYPVDISQAAIAEAQKNIEEAFTSVWVKPVIADLSAGFSFIAKIPAPRLVLFIGSSIGNLEPGEAIDFLRQLSSSLDPGDALLLGTDLVKSPEILVPAYDDAAGVTSAFNKNLLRRINRELGADFDPDAFQHKAIWNTRGSRIEMHLVSLREQTVTLGSSGIQCRFRTAETIHTENSYKYTIESARTMLREGGFIPQKVWTDPQAWFAEHFARVQE